MRLPLRHRPNFSDAEFCGCRHLDNICDASIGLPLTPAVWQLTKEHDRGRYGGALQWHFGLDAHDRSPYPDWEGRIEIKLVSVWQRSDGRTGCDKLKVSDLGIDPWQRLANVRFVFVDRVCRIVIGSHSFQLKGETRRRLESSWNCDPHFGQPDLFVEARESGNRRSPAYYLSASWFDSILPQRALFPFESQSWAVLRKKFGHRDPYIIPIVPDDSSTRVSCPRCGEAITIDGKHMWQKGFFVTEHACCSAKIGDSPRGCVVVDQGRVPMPSCGSRTQQLQAMLWPELPASLQRLSEQVFEPEDHLH